MTTPNLLIDQQHLSWAGGVVYAGLALGSVIAAGALGSLATFPNLSGWYAGLKKPSFSPPNWIFGPVWTLLYLIMAWAFYRILRLPPSMPGRSLAIVAFVVQLTLNASWSWAFFANHSPQRGLVVIVLLWLAIVVTMMSFWPLDVPAGVSFIPYLAWVSFATILNGATYRLNR